MPLGGETGRWIDGPGGDGDDRQPSGIPEQARPAFFAKSTKDIRRFVRNGAIPLESFLLDPDEVFPPGGCVGADMAVKAPAFTAVAVDDGKSFADDFVANAAAKTPAGGTHIGTFH